MADDSFMNTAQTMQNSLKDSKEFKDLKDVYNKLKKDKPAYDTFKAFQQNQAQLQQKQMSGQQISPDDIKKAKQLADEMNKLSVVKELMGKEKDMGQLIDKANMLITQPLRDLYK